MKTNSLIKISMGMASIATLLAASQASAGLSESFSASYGPSAVTVPPTVINLNLPGFNTDGGHWLLDSVTFTLNTVDTVDVSVLNISGVNQPFTTADATISVNAAGPGGLTTKATGVSMGQAGTAIYTSPFGKTDLPSVMVSASSSQTINSALSAYSQGGTYPVALTASIDAFSGSGAPGVYFGGAATSQGTLTVTYNYTDPVSAPEPAAYVGGLAVFAFVAVAGYRKRKLAAV